GQQVTFTATVLASAPGSGFPGGTVIFYDGPVGGPILGNGTLQNGVASIQTTALSTGPHTITVSYQGDSNFLSSTGTLTNYTVTPATTTTNIATSGSPALYGSTVIFTATVFGTSAGAPTPTGNVRFTIDTVPQPLVGLNSSGQAILPISSLSIGQHT